MIPIGDDNHTLRTPIVTYALLGALAAIWIFVQGGGLDHATLASTVCRLGLIPGELTGAAPEGASVPLGPGVACAVSHDAESWLTPLSSMFLHGSWGHLLGNAVFLWVFGNNVEDSMGRGRFLVFYLACGLAAAAAQVVLSPASAVPMVGASGAISGVLGGYLLLYPRVPVRVLFILFIFIRVIRIPAYLVLLWWIGYQIVLGLPEIMNLNPEVSSGVAYAAHIGGFLAGLVLIKLFVRSDFVERHRAQHGARNLPAWQR
jgi:membrane associated rhomboid family serine protease